MKKLFVSAGLLAVTAAAMQSAMADDADQRYWSVGATLRGFYDDNYAIGPSSRGSFGLELTPNVSVHVPFRQTDVGIRYNYGLYYYQDRQDLGVNAFDQTHEVDLWVDHAFNQDWHGRVTDTFAEGQEPELLQPNPVGTIAAPYRVNGDNFANHLGFTLHTDWTPELATTFTYANDFYNYDNSGGTLTASNNPTSNATSFSGSNYGPGYYNLVNGGNGGPSLAGLLNRDEQHATLELDWILSPETTAVLGYGFDFFDYLGDEPVAVVNFPTYTFIGYSPGTPPLGHVPQYLENHNSFVYHSGDRDAMDHKLYVGAQEVFSPTLQGNLNVGASYNDPYADPVNSDGSFSPYATGSLTYTYTTGSYLQAGVDEEMGATDQIAPDSSGKITVYSYNTVGYIDVNHHITQNLIGTVIGRIQYSTFEGGVAGNGNTIDYGLGLNMTYKFTPHWSVDAGYNYDDVESDSIGAGYAYSRNRVYMGVTGSY